MRRSYFAILAVSASTVALALPANAQTSGSPTSAAASDAAQADAVTSSQAVEVGDANPSFIREIILDEDRAKEQPAIDKTIFSDFLKTLFRTFISPQAP